MKPLKRATQKNVTVEMDAYTTYELVGMALENKVSIFINSDFIELTKEEISSLDSFSNLYIRNNYSARIFLDNVKQITVIYDSEMECYRNVVELLTGEVIKITL